MTTRRKSSDCYLLLMLLLALSCAGYSTATTQPTEHADRQADRRHDWQSSLHQDHPLVGRIWLATQERFISRDELLALLQQTPIVLLGEKHDNPDHHRLRLALLDELLLPAEKSLMVLEMMARGQQPYIDALATDAHNLAATELSDRLAWDDQGWSWQFYGPAITLALQRGAKLAAGNIDSSEVMAIYRDTRTITPQPLAAPQLAQLERDIDNSHCGMLPADQFPAMVRVQQARDQQMAIVLTDGDAFDQRILLAGNYHIRHDLGVPNYLPEQFSGRSVSVAFLEVGPEHVEPATYLQQFSDVAAYDVIWFTPALRQDDYCADMRAAQEP